MSSVCSETPHGSALRREILEPAEDEPDPVADPRAGYVNQLARAFDDRQIAEDPYQPLGECPVIAAQFERARGQMG
jgi:hypothetical protein